MGNVLESLLDDLHEFCGKFLNFLDEFCEEFWCKKGRSVTGKCSVEGMFITHRFVGSPLEAEPTKRTQEHLLGRVF